MIKTAIIGACGRMGQSISSVLANDENIEITGAGELKDHPLIGVSLGEVIGNKDVLVKITDNIAKACKDAEVIVDFTSPESTLNNIEYAGKNGKSIVIGTTGFNNTERKKLENLASEVPCVLSPNMSIGVNILFEISKKVASLVGDSYDIEIVEAHHRKKVDSPSGTALGLARAVCEGIGVDLDAVARYERHGNIGERKKGEIGIQTVRGGDVVGDHTVMFLGDGERIELTHKASSRDNFSKGVLIAVKWVHGKAPGLYSMKDVLGLE